MSIEKLEADKELIEEAINTLNTIEQKRIRLEAQLEAEMRQLKKLGHNSLREATVSWRDSMAKLTTLVEEATKDVDVFKEEFDKLEASLGE